MNIEPPFSFLKNWISEGVFKSPFFKDMAAIGGCAVLYFLPNIRLDCYGDLSKKAVVFVRGNPLPCKAKYYTT